MSISYTGDPLWATRDALPSGNPDKQVVADDFRAEFDKISSAFALAAPTASPTFTGAVNLSSATVSYPSSNSLGDVTCDSVINAGNYYSATGSVTANNLIAESTSTLKGNVSCQSQLSVSQIANLNGGGGIYGTWVGSPTFAGSPTFNAGFTIAGGATVSGSGNVNITGNVTSTNVTATNVTASKHLISGVGRFESNAGDPSISRSEGQHLLTVSEEGIQKIGDPSGTQLAIAVGDGVPDGSEPYPIASLYMNSNPGNNVAANMLFLRVNNAGTNTDWVYFNTTAPPPAP